MTHGNPPEDALDAFVYDHFDNPRPRGSGYIAYCPVEAHDDRTPSLSIGLGDAGAILLHCFGGCEVTEVLDAVGITFRDLFLDDAPLTIWQPRRDRREAMWERVAERSVEEQAREAQPIYWEYRAELFAWAGCEVEAKVCRLHKRILEAW